MEVQRQENGFLCRAPPLRLFNYFIAYQSYSSKCVKTQFGFNYMSIYKKLVIRTFCRITVR